MEKARSRRRFLLPGLLLGFILLLTLLFFSIRVCRFQGGSMLPTVREGDTVFFQTWGYTPQCGDIILFAKPGFPPAPHEAAPTVKRIVAVGGQHVRIDYEHSAVYVDGAALDEPYVLEPMVDRHIPSMNILDITVPEGSVYVLGDNRNNSSDSRHEALGTVDNRYVLGRVLYALPFTGFSSPIE